MCITDTFPTEIYEYAGYIFVYHYMRTKLLSLIQRLIQIAQIQGNAIAINKQNARILASRMFFAKHIMF